MALEVVPFVIAEHPRHVFEGRSDGPEMFDGTYELVRELIVGLIILAAVPVGHRETLARLLAWRWSTSSGRGQMGSPRSAFVRKVRTSSS